MEENPENKTVDCVQGFYDLKGQYTSLRGSYDGVVLAKQESDSRASLTAQCEADLQGNITIIEGKDNLIVGLEKDVGNIKNQRNFALLIGGVIGLGGYLLITKIKRPKSQEAIERGTDVHREPKDQMDKETIEEFKKIAQGRK